MKVKICGIKSVDDVMYCNELLPDYIGFVFAPSKRKIDINKALELKKIVNPKIKVVGVFLNNDINEVIDICNKKIIDLIQLHGNEDDNYLKELKEKTGLKIIKAYNDSVYADYILYDSNNPGSGNKGDWSNLSDKKEFFLAGGINIDNVLDAKKLNPYAIDTSSGVERDGKKDYELIKEFIRRVRL